MKIKFKGHYTPEDKKKIKNFLKQNYLFTNVTVLDYLPEEDNALVFMDKEENFIDYINNK